jgi:hypothetical protein
MDIDQYIEDKLTQMQLLLQYAPWAKNSYEKQKIDQELQRIQYLINTADTVVLVNATIESSLNYETPKPQTHKLETGDRSRGSRPGKRLPGKTTMDLKQGA